jgi:hypothetical protein
VYTEITGRGVLISNFYNPKVALYFPSSGEERRPGIDETESHKDFYFKQKSILGPRRYKFYAIAGSGIATTFHKLQNILDEVSVKRTKSEEEVFKDRLRELDSYKMEDLDTLRYDRRIDAYIFVTSRLSSTVYIKQDDLILEFKDVNLSRNEIARDLQHMLETPTI